MSKKLLDKAKVLYTKLHEIGFQTESDEAEEIRCQLDDIWYKASSEEHTEMVRFLVSLNTK